MNRRREFFKTIGLGFLLTGGATAAMTDQEFALAAKPYGSWPPIAPQQRPQYKVVRVPAGDNLEDAFNAAAGEGFQYAGPAQRYGQTEFIFVRWVPVESVTSGVAG